MLFKSKERGREVVANIRYDNVRLIEVRVTDDDLTLTGKEPIRQAELICRELLAEIELAACAAVGPLSSAQLKAVSR